MDGLTGPGAGARDTKEEAPAPRAVLTPRPCQITFEGFASTEAVKQEVRAWLERLGGLTISMIAGRVVISAIDEDRKRDRKHREQRYRVAIELSMPDGVVVVAHEHPSNAAHDDVYVAVRNAFRAARRQLELHALAHPTAVAIDAAGAGAPVVAELAVA
jgi:ribosome-associated translation inhibitor RaiA